MPREHRVDLSTDLPTSRRMVAEAADAWGGLWQGEGVAAGRLGLPVFAGLRRGWVAGPLSFEKNGSYTRIHFLEENAELRVHWPSFLLLLAGALGGIFCLAAPFAPHLLRLLPFALIAAVCAWFFAVAQLRNSGPEEFFETLAEETRRSPGE